MVSITTTAIGWYVSQKETAPLWMYCIALCRIVSYRTLSYRIILISTSLVDAGQLYSHRSNNNLLVCRSLLVFHRNYVCISYRFWDIQHQNIMAWPWNRGYYYYKCHGLECCHHTVAGALYKNLDGVEEIHSVGTINNVETSYFTQLKI